MMIDVVEAPVRSAPDELISFILERYHEVHRRELPMLIDLAGKVEAVHVHDEWAPRGLSQFLQTLLIAMDQHMRKEEMILFPAMNAGRQAGIQVPIQVMRGDHEAHLDDIAHIKSLTNNLFLPDGACRSWADLYTGLQKFIDDLLDHIRLENETLFPMFENQGG